MLQQLMVSSEVNIDDRETAANILDQVLELAQADGEGGGQVLEHFEVSKLLDSLRIEQTPRAKLFLLRTLRQQVTPLPTPPENPQSPFPRIRIWQYKCLIYSGAVISQKGNIILGVELSP